MNNSITRVLFVVVFLSFHSLPASVTLAHSKLTSGQATNEERKYAVAVEAGIKVKMRDGITLAADIYRPREPGTFPVLLQRTPYSRQSAASMGYDLASHGYIVVLQDTRGRYDSGGEFYPFRFESQDGYDTVEWAAALNGSNGKVGMFGGSYVGATQMLAAMAKPPHLVTIFPYVTASEYYDGWTYQNGVLAQWFASSWASSLAVDTVRRKAAERARPKDWVAQLPVESYPLIRSPSSQEIAPYFRDWIQHERNDDYWRQWKISDHYHEMNVTALHAGGWHDLFLNGSIKNYMGMHEKGPTPAIRSGQRLLIGPWAHASTSSEGKIGDVVFGKSAVLDMTGTALRWFDYTLKGAQNDFASESPVSIFVMGENVWRAEKEFPLARTRYEKYFLHSTRTAKSVAGDGTLSLAAPGTEPTDSFEYDPANPVPTIGGRLCCGDAIPPGPFDQRPNESRNDVLVFSTPALDRDVEVTGFIKLELYASTSVKDTDFTALLVDVDPSGYARFLTDGIVRARYRNVTDKPEEVVPGQVYKYELDLWATSNLFKTGHKIRLYISSSNFPRFNRNLNTGEPMFGSSRTVKAQQTIYHDSRRPSAIVLPIIPR